MQVKKKLVENFQFDVKNVKIERQYEIIESRNILLNQLFTLKRFSLDGPQSQAKYERLLRQISILKELNGNHVVKCHKVLKSKTHVYLVCDHFSGKTLNDIIQINQQIIQSKGKIDSNATAKSQENFIDIQMIYNIGKQFYQILAQIHSKNILHLHFIPQNLILQKNGLFKLTNFSHVQIIKNSSQIFVTEINLENDFIDPYFRKTNLVGSYTDIYSYGVIMQKMYKIYEFSQNFQPNKQMEDFIQKLTKQNPQQRAKQKQILDFFIGTKKKQQISKKRSRDDLIQKTSRTKLSKQQLSTCRSLKSVNNRPSTIRISGQKVRSRKQVYNFRSSDIRERQTRRKDSDSFKTSLSRNKNKNDFSPTSQKASKNQIQLQSNHEINDFQKIKSKILNKKNQSMLILQITNIIVNQIQGQNMITFQLTYLLYKKSMIELVTLAKYLSKGSPKYMFDLSESLRLKFIKTSNYSSLCKVINQQLQEQRSVLANISIAIIKQKLCLTNISERQNYQFEKQLKFQALNNQFFMQTIKKYLESFMQDFIDFNLNVPNSRIIFFYLNLLLQLYRNGSYENFIAQIFEIDSVKTAKQSNKINNIKNSKDILKKNSRIQKLKQSNVNELSKNLRDFIEKERS